MKITNLRLLQVQGEMEFPGAFWEERLVRPLDLYPQHRHDPPGSLRQLDEGRYRMESTFVRIETDEGVSASAARSRPSTPTSLARNSAPC